MEVSGDLESLVGPFLRHGVRELAQDLLTLCELDVRLFERLRPKEHLPGEHEGRQDGGKHPSPTLIEHREREAEDAKPQVLIDEFATTPDSELPDHFAERHS